MAREHAVAHVAVRAMQGASRIVTVERQPAVVHYLTPGWRRAACGGRAYAAKSSAQAVRRAKPLKMICRNQPACAAAHGVTRTVEAQPNPRDKPRVAFALIRS